MGNRTVTCGKGAIGCAVEMIKEIGKAFIYAALLLPQLAWKAVQVLSSSFRCPVDTIGKVTLDSNHTKLPALEDLLQGLTDNEKWQVTGTYAYSPKAAVSLVNSLKGVQEP